MLKESKVEGVAPGSPEGGRRAPGPVPGKIDEYPVTLQNLAAQLLEPRLDVGFGGLSVFDFDNCRVFDPHDVCHAPGVLQIERDAFEIGRVRAGRIVGNADQQCVPSLAGESGSMQSETHHENTEQ